MADSQLTADGWLPEGIAIGPGPTFYAGSRADGALYRGDVRTGEGDVFIPGEAGRIAVGLQYDARWGLLFVAGGPTGEGYAYDADSGAEVERFEFTIRPSFVNDVTVAAGPVDPITLAGDWTQVVGFNANGIVADASESGYWS